MATKTEPKEVKEPVEAPVETNHDELSELKKKLEEQQKTIDMLSAVADKGRLLNYQNKNANQKIQKIHLSVTGDDEDKVLVGWRTLKDRLIQNPTTGLTVGEEQEYELLLLGKEGKIEKTTINGYPRFSDIRYSNRIEAQVIGRKEDLQGNVEFEVELPDGRKIDIDARFVN